MVKSKEEVIAQFNKYVNMSVEELQAWLDNPQSEKAGTGVGIESGHKIIEILKKNPEKDPEKYAEEDIEHMRKVVSYNSRHLAQEDHLKETKTRSELEDTKSTISLKNWGHDPLKTLDESAASSAEVDSETIPDSGGETTAADKSDVDASGHEEAECSDQRTKRKLGERENDENNAGSGDNHVKEKATKSTDDEDRDDGYDKEDDEQRARKKSKTVDDHELEDVEGERDIFGDRADKT